MMKFVKVICTNARLSTESMSCISTEDLHLAAWAFLVAARSGFAFDLHHLFGLCHLCAIVEAFFGASA
jgi:hypothetical protein